MAQCLQYNIKRRFTLKRMLAHPFLAQTPAKKCEELKSVPSLHPIEEKKIVKYPIVQPYTCYCDKRPDVILSCQHDFCVGCAVEMRERATVKEQETNHYFITEETRALEYLLFFCPKCLAYCRISTLIGECRRYKLELRLPT
eukprot:TRINITY_DN16734_c0_g1_i1.p1 TRINITY_DN16734_c0_g1~~TRINITY_DN16734_c0_g1_i1.p1  ORF type:complete len:142 (+),score=10.42 TRINITY_DN16734_c0_g1_i1:111-536(+)